MGPIVSPEMVSTSNIVTKGRSMDLTPSLAQVIDSESITALPHRRGTQKTDLVTESKIIDQVTNKILFTSTKYISRKISISKRLNETERELSTTQRIRKEDEKLRNSNHRKLVQQQPNNPSKTAAQNLIQTIARMYTSRGTTPEILGRFQVRS